MPFRKLKPNPDYTAQDALDAMRRIRLGEDGEDANVGGHLKANEHPRPLNAAEARALLSGSSASPTPEMEKLLAGLGERGRA